MIDKVIQFEKNIDVYRKLADSRAEEGDFEGALRFLFSAKIIEPDNLDVICDIADIYADMGLVDLSNCSYHILR